MTEVECTDDGRYIAVDGRRWRATDPSVPDGLRDELVAELMDARREIGRLGRADGACVGADRADAIAAARQRVHDAKVALGERGAPWWDAPSPETLRVRAAATARALVHHRGGPINPSDVARVVGGDDWRSVLDQVRRMLDDVVTSDDVVEGPT